MADVTPQQAPLTLIGLGGYARAGKDTAADYLVDRHRFVKVGMSDALHAALLELNPLIEHQPNAMQYGLTYREHFAGAPTFAAAKKHPEVRRIMQSMGTDVVRNMIDPDAWVKATLRKIGDLHMSGRDRIVLTGVRFKNELDAVHSLHGHSVWVDRPGTKPINGHISEQSLSPYSFTHTLLNHNGQLATLHVATETLVADLGIIA